MNAATTQASSTLFTVEVGFDLKYVKHYASPENAVKAVEKELAGLISQGVVFHCRIMQQLESKDGKIRVRHIPMLCAFRTTGSAAFSGTQAAIFAARAGFPVSN